MTYRPYPKYKDSGIAWLGEVPEHWGELRLKFIASVQFSNVDKHTKDDEIPIKLCNYVDVYYNDYITSDLAFMDATATPDEIRKFILTRGDVIVTKDSESWDDIAIPAVVNDDLEGVICGYHLAQIRPMKDRALGHYLFRAFASSGLKEQFMVAASGVTRFGIGMYTISNAVFPTPPIEEQYAITSFLDRETARIDALIEKKQRQIELLQEKRAALISHAVTKGLDPNVKMKDSGIEWLGEVPEHWEVVRLGRLSSSLSTGPFGSQLHAEEYVDGGIPVINPANLQGGRIVPDNRCSITEEKFRELQRHTLRYGDIVFGRRGEMGRCAMVDEVSDGFLCGTGSIRVRLNTRYVNPQFLTLYLSIAGVRDHLLLESVGSTMDNLNTGILSRIPCTLPCLEEQDAIAAFVQVESLKNMTIGDSISASIDGLREFRTALISAAVTGKIDVREEVS